MPFPSTTHRPPKRTKIVATVGPASCEPDVLRRMILAGMDVARLNFSHGDHDSHAAVIHHVRELSDQLGVPVAILGDLRGPRVRVGEIQGGHVCLTTGRTITLTPETVTGDTQRMSISFTGLAADLKPGDTLLIDDGDVVLAVQEISSNRDIRCTIVEGGAVSSRRGINLPGIHVSLPSLTDKDKEDVSFAVEQGIDFLALSFVQSADDVSGLNELLRERGADIAVIAKIEKKGALDDIDAVIREAYGVMVARGDLALEMSFQEVPVAQKRIIARCRAAASPVITATQMLESMIERDHPTRAEATDVANAVFDGTDALMLSGETAMGRYPVESVATMATIAARAEAAWVNGEVPRPAELAAPCDVDSTIARLGHVAACDLRASAIVTYTQSGSTARRLCRHRPPAPILALTPCAITRWRLALSWGVAPVLCDPIHDLSQVSNRAIKEAQRSGLGHPGDSVVVMAGSPLGVPGSTNLLKVERVT
jgi:pyruvate kinase